MTLKKKRKIEACLKKLACQCHPLPEARLFFAVFQQAIRDYFNNQIYFDYRDHHNEQFFKSRRYLMTNLDYLDLVGIDPDYARFVFKRMGLSLPGPE